MRYTKDWNDYELLDCSGGERLERWGSVILVRPDPQVIWKTPKRHPLWNNANARYLRSKTGGGAWETYSTMPQDWAIRYRDLTFRVKPMGFKHTGLFPEQAVNWDLCMDLIRKSDRRLKVLNLFAYTGGATIACLKAGAEVVHVDASKGMVQWAKENAKASGVDGCPVRWIVDDCLKFVQREIRRGNRYDIIIMDPPSYGRGPGGEVWKLEDEVYRFVETCAELLDDASRMMLINSYTTGLSPSVMEYILSSVVSPRLGGSVSSSEIGLPVSGGTLVLPCGATSIWKKD